MKMEMTPLLGNLPVVAVDFNGEKYSFLLDTGAAEVLLSPATAKKLIGAKPEAAEPVSVQTSGGPAGGWRTPYNFQFAGSAINSVVIADLPSGIDGVLGVHILQSFKAIVIDFPHNAVEFNNGDESQLAQADVFVSDRRHPCGALMLHCRGCKDDFCISQLPVYCPSCGRKISEGSIEKLKQGFAENILPVDLETT